MELGDFRRQKSASSLRVIISFDAFHTSTAKQTALMNSKEALLG